TPHVAEVYGEVKVDFRTASASNHRADAAYPGADLTQFGVAGCTMIFNSKDKVHTTRPMNFAALVPAPQAWTDPNGSGARTVPCVAWNQDNTQGTGSIVVKDDN